MGPAPTVLGSCGQPVRPINSEPAMSKSRQTASEQEPIGIVISMANREEAAPRFLSYEWFPAPECADACADMRAA